MRGRGRAMANDACHSACGKLGFEIAFLLIFFYAGSVRLVVIASLCPYPTELTLSRDYRIGRRRLECSVSLKFCSENILP